MVGELSSELDSIPSSGETSGEVNTESGAPSQTAIEAFQSAVDLLKTHSEHGWDFFTPVDRAHIIDCLTGVLPSSLLPINEVNIGGNVAEISAVQDADPFDRNQVFDLTDLIQKAKKLGNESFDAIEERFPYLSLEKLEEIHTFLDLHKGEGKRLAAMVEKAIECKKFDNGPIKEFQTFAMLITKLVKVAGDQRIARDSRMTENQAKSILSSIIIAIRSHVDDPQIVARIARDIKMLVSMDRNDLAQATTRNVDGQFV